MATLAEIRRQYPQYGDLPDAEFADKFYQKFYSDMPRADFDQKVGLAPAPAQGALGVAQGAATTDAGLRTPGPVGVPEDVARSLGSGLVSGTAAIPGLVGDAPDLVAKGVSLVKGWTGASSQDQADAANYFRVNASYLPRTADVEKFISDKTGWQPYEPQTPFGRYAETIGEFVPSAAVGGGIGGALRGGVAGAARGVATNAVKYGAIGGATSEGGGDLAAALVGPEARPYGQMAGALVGPTALSRAITPFPATAARNAAVATLRNEGVDALTAGQRTGNTALRYWESETGGPAVADAMDAQGGQFTRAVLARAGIAADRATPEVVNTAFDRIGGDFNRLSANNALAPDPQFANDIRGVVTDYGRLVNQPSQSPAIGHYLTEIGNAVGGGQGAPIAGDVYQSLRSRIAADARSAGDQYTQRALNGMVDALDNAMERSIAANNPNDLGAFQQARNQYRNMLVIERAATGAGEAAAQGIISPAQLRMATQSVTGRRAYARGLTDFDELARAGIQTMTPLPQSGTAPRAAARAANATPALLGAALAGQYGQGDVLTTLLGGAAGLAIPRVARGAAFSPVGRAYLGNQVLGGANATPRTLAAALALNNATLPARLPDGRPFNELATALASR